MNLCFKDPLTMPCLDDTNISLQEMASSLHSVKQIVVKLIQFLQQHSFNFQHRNHQHYQIQALNHHPSFMPPAGVVPQPGPTLMPRPMAVHHPPGPSVRISHHPLQPRLMPHMYNRPRGPPPRIH